MLIILVTWYSCYTDILVIYSSYLLDTCLYTYTHDHSILYLRVVHVYLLFVPVIWGVICAY